MSKLIWTTTKPSEAGWYWAKHRLPDRTPTIVYLSNDSVTSKPVLAVCFCDGTECWLHEDCFDGWQWSSDPIQMPEEP